MNTLRIIHPEVKALLGKLDQYSKLSISYTRQSQSLELIRNLVQKALIKGKRVAIVSNNTLENELLTKDLKQMGLDNLLINLTKNEGILEAKHLDFEQLLRAHQTKSVDINYLKHIKSLNQHLEKSLLDGYKFLNKPIFEDLNWQSLIDFKALMERNRWSSILDQKIDQSMFAWSSDEFMELRKELQHKIFHFKIHFTSLHDQDPFHDNYYAEYEDERSLDNSISHIQDLINKLLDIQNVIREQMERQRSLSIADESVLFGEVKQACDEFQKLKSLSAYLEERKRISPLKTGLLGFEKDPIQKELEQVQAKIEKQIKIINQNTSLSDLSLYNYDNIDVSGIKNQLSEILILNKEKDEPLVFEIDDSIAAINELYEQLNHESWMKDSFCLIHFKPQEVIEQLDKDIFVLKKAEIFAMNNTDYISWKSNSSENNEVLTKIIEALSFTDAEDWCDLFENWYLINILNRNFNHHFVEAFDYESYHAQTILEQETEDLYLQRYWFSQKQWASKTFEEEQIEIKRMLRSQINRLNVEVAYGSWGKLISSYFPITIIDENRLCKNPELMNNWDHIYAIDSDDLIKVIGASQLKPGRKFVAIQSITNPICDETDFNLTGRGYFVTKTNEDMKLKLAKALSQEIIQTCLPKKVVQTKTHTLISFWSEPKNNMMTREIGDFKEINLGENPVETLNDLLVEESKEVIFLLQDGLMKIEEDKTLILSQLSLLKLLEQNGFKTKNIWAKDYFLIGKELISSLLADLSQQVTEKIKDLVPARIEESAVVVDLP